MVGVAKELHIVSAHMMSMLTMNTVADNRLQCKWNMIRMFVHKSSYLEQSIQQI